MMWIVYQCSYLSNDRIEEEYVSYLNGQEKEMIDDYTAPPFSFSYLEDGIDNDDDDLMASSYTKYDYGGSCYRDEFVNYGNDPFDHKR